MAYLQTNQFQKFERLNGKRPIAFLFEKGDTFNLYPFKVFKLQPFEAQDFCLKVLFSVTKRNFPLAVERNRVKRLLREAYRKNKQELMQLLLEKKMNLHVAFIYTGKDIADITVIEKQMISCLKKIQNELG